MTAKCKNREETAKVQRRRRRLWKERRELQETLRQMEERAARMRAARDRSRRRATRLQAKVRRAELELEAASRAKRELFEDNELANIRIDLFQASFDAQDQGDAAMAAQVDRVLRELMPDDLLRN